MKTSNKSKRVKSLLAATALSATTAALFGGCIQIDTGKTVEVSATPGGSASAQYGGATAANCAIAPRTGTCQSYSLPLARTNITRVFAAHSDSGFVFDGWSGNCTLWDLNDASNSCTVAGGTLAKKIAAHFKPTGYVGSYTKLDAAGKALPADATEWACVKDNISGLTWEAKTSDGGRHDASWTYSWFAKSLKSDLFDATKRNAGIANGGTCATGSTCDTADFIRVVRSEKLCGAINWRLPSLQELNSLVIPSRAGSVPIVDAQFFPDTAAGASYWSSQLRIDGGVDVMAAQRHDNGASSFDAIEGGSAVPHAVRLVR